MAGQISKIKRQLRSVNSTKKITNAMGLVATAKLQKQRSRMSENNLYAETFYQFVLAAATSKDDDNQDPSPYLVGPKEKNPLHIVVTSNSGLCGSYNMDLIKYVQANISKDEPIFAIGTYGIKWLTANNYLVVKRLDELDDLKPSKINAFIYNILKLYQDGEISKIDIVYTQYINTLSFVPTTFELLPLEIPKNVEPSNMLFEPSKNDVLDQLIPQYVSSMIYSTLLQAKTSEQAARRSAMDAANKNADNLIAELQLTYNQARQAAITTEMNEIIAGSQK